MLSHTGARAFKTLVVESKHILNPVPELVVIQSTINLHLLIESKEQCYAAKGNEIGYGLSWMAHVDSINHSSKIS